MPRPLIGLVLAAGAGRRMGGPKALLRLAPHGPSLVEVAVARMREAGCADVVVVVGASAEAVRRHVAGVGATSVDCPDWEEGMGASLRTGLAYLHDVDAGCALVSLVDLPDVGAEVMTRVIEEGAEGPTAAGDAALARAAYDGIPGHPVLLGRDHWAGVAGAAEGDRGGRDYLADHPPLLVECGDLATGRDVDRPADI